MRPRIDLIAAAAWTVVLGVALAHDLYSTGTQIMDMAYAEARANLDKDITFRRWSTAHGGVYVPITETQKSIPWLDHVPGRDVVTTDGRRLTLLNPATMLRQMMDRYAQDYGIRGRITGLKYLNPANAPDEWERSQLEAFARGEGREVWAEADLDGAPHLRYLRAMMMEPGCDKCHAILGYKTGDFRGATGINLPLAPYYAQIESERRKHALTYGGIWLLGLLGIGAAVRNMRRHDGEREAAEKRYRTLFEQSRDGILTVDPQTRRFTEFNTVAHTQLGYTREEFAGLSIVDIEAVESPTETAAHVEKVRRDGWDNFETRHRRKDGEIRDVHVIVQLVEIDGKPQLHCTFRDITERKQTERALQLYANIFENSGEAISSRTGRTASSPPTPPSRGSPATASTRCAARTPSCWPPAARRRRPTSSSGPRCGKAASGRANSGTGARTASPIRSGRPFPPSAPPRARWTTTSPASPTSASARPPRSASTISPTTTPSPAYPTASAWRAASPRAC